MAKKVVATLKTPGGKDWVKVVRSVKNADGHYSFKEEIVHVDRVQDLLKSDEKK